MKINSTYMDNFVKATAELVNKYNPCRNSDEAEEMVNRCFDFVEEILGESIDLIIDDLVFDDDEEEEMSDFDKATLSLEEEVIEMLREDGYSDLEIYKHITDDLVNLGLFDKQFIVEKSKHLRKILNL